MKTLINFEIKKFFARKKNIILILLFLILSTALILIHCNLENKYIESERKCISSDIKSVQEAIKSAKEMQKKFPQSNDPQNDIDLYTEQLNLLNDKQNSLLNNNNIKYLKSLIKLDENLLTNIQNNKVVNPSEKIGDIEKRINVNKYLLKKNLKPIFTNVSMKGFNFITLFFNAPFAVIIMLLIITLYADIASSEYENNTYKLLFTQPISTVKIFLSKVISAFIVTTILVLVATVIFFGVLSVIKGTGSSQYPVVFFDGNVQKLIPISEFVIYILEMQILFMLFLCILSVLVSAIFKNTGTSISILVVISVSLYMIANSGLLSKVAFLNPFTYVNVNNVLQGIYSDLYNVPNVNFYNGIVLLIVLIVVLIGAGIFYSSKNIFVYKNKD